MIFSKILLHLRSPKLSAGYDYSPTGKTLVDTNNVTISAMDSSSGSTVNMLATFDDTSSFCTPNASLVSGRRKRAVQYLSQDLLIAALNSPEA